MSRKFPVRKNLEKNIKDIQVYLKQQGFGPSSVDVSQHTEVIQGPTGAVGFSRGGPIVFKITLFPKSKKPTKREIAKRKAADRRYMKKKAKAEALHKAGKCDKETCSLCEDERLDAESMEAY